MNDVLVGMVLVPGVFALLLFLVFSYLYEQTRETYFRAWQIGWGAYCVQYVLLGLYFSHHAAAAAFLLARLLLVGTGLCIFVSRRLLHEPFRVYRHDLGLAAAGVALALWDLGAHFARAALQGRQPPFHVEVEIGVAALLVFTALRFYRVARPRDSVGFRLLAMSLVIWSILLAARQFHQIPMGSDAGHPMFTMAGGEGMQGGWMMFQQLAGVLSDVEPVAIALVGLAMVMVLFETERRTVQENALAFSTLDIEAAGLLAPAELVPSLEKLLDRLLGLVHTGQAAICIAERWRAILPSVQRGFSAEFLSSLESRGAGEYLSEMAYRRGGLATLSHVAQMSEPLHAGPSGHFRHFQEVMARENVAGVTAVSLQTRERNFGIVLFPHTGRKALGSAQVRMLLGVAMQIGMTLENYVLMHDAKRRTKEYELLTQMGQVISSRLDSDEVLRAIHAELGLLFDTTNFHIAFLDKDEVRFEFEVINGEPQPKRSRRAANGLAEYITRTGQPLLIRSELETARARLGCTFQPERPARCYIGVPILMGGRPAGVMAAMHFEREFVFEQRDVDVLQTAAGQVAVAVENARLFSEEQRRARYLGFLNNVSKTAISSEDAAQMLAEIVGEIQKNFHFDHIGIGMLDYATKEIEIKAEAGTTAQGVGKRVPLGVGILGRVARTNETALVQNTMEGGHLLGILPDSRSVLCIPITYGETLLGVLNIESRRENAFAQQEVLILRTLADLLATALHNAFVFQKLQQQSITDGLTGIKTRRFFIEALQSEWKRASRSGRPFSVVLIDLDKFKDVNDTMGHLEGDLVLARVGRLLEQKCRQSNVVARYGGDEFVILMPETTVEQAQILSERLRLWIATDPMLNERHISGSFGVASFPLHGSSVEDIIRVADAGMYVSKHAGGNRVSTAEEIAEEEGSFAQRQLLAAYIEGFLQREHTGPESVEELVGTLRKLCGGMEEPANSEALMQAISALSRAAETREVHSAGHGETAARHAEAIARELGMPSDEIMDLIFAARVHDVGKIIIPEKILCKPGPLSEDEFYVVKMHASVGAEIVGTVPNGDRMKLFVKHHHERFDGTGYPDGLRGEQIPLGARILGVVDAWVNMISERPFAPAKAPSEAVAEMQAMSGTQFDGAIVKIFLRQLRGRSATRGK
jgi:diguanylate cyclase (GGDEF)-like protein